MTLPDYVSKLKARLRDLSSQFTDPADFEDMIETAVREFSRYRPRIMNDSLTLVAGTDTYVVTGLKSIAVTAWGRTTGRKPWEDSPGTPPTFSVLDGQVVFLTAPTSADIAVWGSTFKFTARFSHVIDATASTVADDDEPLITLRARAEALSILAGDSAGKPGGKTGTGFGVSRDATYAGQAERLMDRWNEKMGIG